MSDNTISVVIPFFNGDLGRLESTLESLRRQTRPADEILIVDDGSSSEHADALVQAALVARAHVIHQKNAGPAAARNRGAQQASGTWLAFLDADDLWTPNKLEAQLACASLPGNEDKLILCRTGTVDTEGHVLRENSLDVPAGVDAFVDQILYGKVHSFTSSIFIKRLCFLELGGFDSKLRYREDQHFLIRAIRKLGWVSVPERLSNRVLHDQSYTATRKVVPATDLLARHVRFADALDGVEPRLKRSSLIARFALAIGKNMAADRRTGEALIMSAVAVRHRPTDIRSWFLAPASLIAALKPSLFATWRSGAGLK